MKRVLLTGGTGFVGANLARRLIADGHEVHLAVRKGHRPWRIEGLQNARVVEIPFGDPARVDAAVREIRPEWIFHLAVYGAYSDQRDWREMVQTNVIGTANLLESCMQQGFEAFINTGSSSEYGFKSSAPAEEDSVEPNSHYAVSKVSSTLHCAFMARTHSLPLATLRLYSAYGPFEEPTRLIPALLMNGFAGKFPPLANPAIARDYVYVSDVCDAYIRAAEKASGLRGDIFNVATGTQTTLREIVDVVRSLLNVKREPEWGTMAARDWDTNVWVGNPTKIRRELGWEPVTTLHGGLRLFADWLLANPDMMEKYRA